MQVRSRGPSRSFQQVHQHGTNKVKVRCHTCCSTHPDGVKVDTLQQLRHWTPHATTKAVCVVPSACAATDGFQATQSQLQHPLNQQMCFTLGPPPQVTGTRLPAVGRTTPSSSSRLAADAANSSSSLVLAEPSLTRRMFEAVDARQSAGAGGGGQAGGAGGRTTYQALLAADQAWQNIRNMQVGVIVGQG